MARPKGRLDKATRLDEAVFDVRTPESEYWVGFLMADGCVNYPAGGRTPRISLLLSVKDAEHVHAFARFLKTNLPVRVTATHASLQVRSSRLVDALRRYGVTEKKTHSAEVLGLENSADFWRGVIDGDGSLIRAGVKPPTLNLVGSRRLLEQWVRFVEFGAICRHESIFRVVLNGRRAVATVKRLYSTTGPVLARKRAKAEEIMAWVPRPPIPHSRLVAMGMGGAQ